MIGDGSESERDPSSSEGSEEAEAGEEEEVEAEGEAEEKRLDRQDGTGVVVDAEEKRKGKQEVQRRSSGRFGGRERRGNKSLMIDKLLPPRCWLRSLKLSDERGYRR